jgi:hypothetical protein
MSYRYWRGKAQERLDILALIVDVWEVDASTVYSIAEYRASNSKNADENPGPRTYVESNTWNKAWRVFYDLQNRTTAP